MFLIAGLLGMVATGLVVAGPGLLNREDDDLSDRDIDVSDAKDAADDQASSLLTEAFAEEDSKDTDPSNDGALAQLILDQVAGNSLSTVVDGHSGSAIAHQDFAMFGNGSDNIISGDDASNLILGDGGDDSLAGGGARDELHGGGGDDLLRGDTGDDILKGDPGDDLLEGDAGDDLLVGGAGDDTLRGGDGNDRLFGSTGRDLLDGGAGNDLLDGTDYGATGTVDLDVADRLEGGEGDDTLAAGTGDTVSGGEGGDLFLFRAPSAGLVTPPPTETGTDGPLVTDFDNREDWIEIIYDPVMEPSPGVPPMVSIIDDANGPEVRIDGTLVLRLTPGSSISPDDLRLVADI